MNASTEDTSSRDAEQSELEPLELLRRSLAEVSDPSWLAGFEASWQLAASLQQAVWSERTALLALGPDHSAVAEGVDDALLEDPRELSLFVADRLRALAEVLRRSGSMLSSSQHSLRDAHVGRVVTDAATSVSMTSDALTHLVSHYLEALPPWELEGVRPDPASSPAEADVRTGAWLAAYTAAASLARQPGEDAVAWLLLVARHDPDVIEDARRHLADVDLTDPTVRERAEAWLLVAAARARRGRPPHTDDPSDAR